MKKCPYCAEEIQDDAIKCRYCHEWLKEEFKKNDTVKTREIAQKVTADNQKIKILKQNDKSSETKKLEPSKRKINASIENVSEADRLREPYSGLSDEELIKIVYIDYREYREDALDIAKEEINRRGLEKATNKEIELILQSDSIPPEDLGSEFATISGFGWGKVWLGLCYFQGVIAIVAGGIFGLKTEYLPNRAFSLITGSILVIIAYNVQKRKKIGLYGVYSLCVLNIIGLSISSITATEEHQIFVVVYVAIQILWLIYFYKRRKWFA